MNRALATIIVAPMTLTIRNYPTRVPVTFQIKQGEVLLDQIRTVDKRQTHQRLGFIRTDTCAKILSMLNQMFSL